MIDSDILYRLGLVSDVNGIHNVDAICFGKQAYSEQYIHSLMAHPDMTFIVATHHGAIIGNIGFFSNSIKKSLISCLGVHPDFRKRGIANSLMALAEASIEAKHCARCIKLQVRINNYGAIHLYEKRGYHIVKVLKKYYTTIDAYMMVKASPTVLANYVTKKSSRRECKCTEPDCKYSAISYSLDADKKMLICTKHGESVLQEVINL
jgi:ribosomal protein S18 acetylase RimI-like enzyme